MPILNSQETAALEELRLRMKNYLSPEQLKNEIMLYRFLKARDFKVDLSEAMLRKAHAWRKAHQVETYLTDYKVPEVMEKYFSYNSLGYAKDDSPVLYSCLGGMHYDSLFKSIKDTELYKHYIYMLEDTYQSMETQNEKTGKEIYQVTLIFDFKGLTFSKAANKQSLRSLMTFVIMTNAYYPERLKILYAINAPACFSIMFSFVKPILPEAVLKKIQIFGANGWKDSLLKAIDEDVLPAFLGGKRTDPGGNPLCNSFVIHGGKIPEKYYMRNTRTPMYKRTDARRLLIPTFSKEQVEINVAQHDHMIEWEYETKYGDIGFGLFYQEYCSDGSKMEELIPVEKIHSCDGSERGIFNCEKPGIYILLFDNSFSYFYQKEVYYNVITKRRLTTKN